jgi:hypothetical protein
MRKGAPAKGALSISDPPLASNGVDAVSPNIAPSSAQDRPRTRCRNSRCGSKLRPAVDNVHHAFCCVGCHAAYHRNRCIVCEAKLPSGPSNREICRRSECRAALRKFPQRYRWPKTGERPQRSARFTGLKIGTKSGRAWRKVAGPDAPEINLHIPLNPEFVAQLDRKHAAYHENRQKAKRKAQRTALIKRRHPPVNVLGGYKFRGAPEIDLSPIEALSWAIPSRWIPSGTGIDMPGIPDFLERKVSAAIPTRRSEEAEHRAWCRPQFHSVGYEVMP